MQSRLRTYTFALLASLSTSACTTTRSQAAEYVQAGTEAVRQLTQAQYDTALALGGDPDVLQPLEATFQQAAADNRARLAALAKQMEEQQLKLTSLVTSLSSALSVASNPAGIAAGLLERFRGTERKARDLEVATSKTASTQQSQQNALAHVEARVDTSVNDATQSAQKLREEVSERLKTESAALRSEFSKLSDDTLFKLSQLTESTVDKLTRLSDNEAELRAEIARAAQLSKEQAEELDGLGTTELLTILAAAASAAAAGGALGKTGRSRAQSEVDKLKVDVGLIKKQ